MTWLSEEDEGAGGKERRKNVVRRGREGGRTQTEEKERGRTDGGASGRVGGREIDRKEGEDRGALSSLPLRGDTKRS